MELLRLFLSMVISSSWLLPSMISVCPSSTMSLCVDRKHAIAIAPPAAAKSAGVEGVYQRAFTQSISFGNISGALSRFKSPNA
jgi:hypothetical protein